jgi:hypothetical protein
MPIDQVWSFKPPGVPTLIGKLNSTRDLTWGGDLIEYAARLAFEADYGVVSHGVHSFDWVLAPNGKRVATLTRKVGP